MISILQGEVLGFPPHMDPIPGRGSIFLFYQGPLVYVILIWMYLRYWALGGFLSWVLVRDWALG